MNFKKLLEAYDEAIEKHERPTIDVVLILLLKDEDRESDLTAHYIQFQKDAYTFHKGFRTWDVCSDSFAIWKLMSESNIFFSVFNRLIDSN